jgi:hypothetical protein
MSLHDRAKAFNEAVSRGRYSGEWQAEANEFDYGRQWGFVIRKRVHTARLDESTTVDEALMMADVYIEEREKYEAGKESQ